MINYQIWNGKRYVRECVLYRFSNFITHRLCYYEIGDGNGYGYGTDMIGHIVKEMDLPNVVHIVCKRRVSLKRKVGESLYRKQDDNYKSS